MKTGHSTYWLPAIGMAVAALPFSPSINSAADSLIGVNFTGAITAGAPTALSPGESAGVVPQTQWNNFSDIIVTNYPLRDNTGNLTGITVTYSTDEMWGSGTYSELDGTTNGNAQLLNGYLNARTGAYRTNIVTFRGLTPGNHYSVVAYTLRDNSGAQAAYWVNDNAAASFHILSEGRFEWISDPQFRRGTNTVVDAQGFVAEDLANYGNYVLWDDVGPKGDGSLTVSVASEPNISGNSTERGPVNGIQLVSAAAYPPNTSTPQFVLQPRNVRVTLGQRGTFRATTDGPWSYQWYSNNVSILGAVSNAFTTVPISGIEDTRVNYHVVANNGSLQTASDSVHVILVPDLPLGGIFYDGFDYPEGPLGNWGEWNLDNLGVIDAPGLTYSDGTNSLQVGGNAMIPPREPGGWNNFRYIAVKSFGTTKYGGPNTTNFMSFLYDFRNLTSAGGIGVSGFEGTGDWGNERFFIGKVYGREFIGFDSGPPNTVSDFTIYTNAFVVVRIIQDDSVATFDMFINPPLIGLPDVPTVSAVRGTTFQFDGVAVNAGDWNRADTNAPGPFVDEFRFGSTYASVAPIAVNPPVLAIERLGAQVRISWSPNTPGYALEATTSLSSPNWLPAPAGNPVTIPIDPQPHYFRLQK